MKSQIDHLVVAAHSLQQGVEWCEATLGITPAAGGEHEKYGTHNRLFKIATPAFPVAYLEIIAINPDAVIEKKPPPTRWFDLDNSQLQAELLKSPRLIHFVANTSNIQDARHAWKAQGIDRGPVIHASRKTPKGLLQWQITVRLDGDRLFDGTLPTLIQWGKPEAADPMHLHPRNHLPRSGVSLKSLSVSHPSAGKIQTAYDAISLGNISVSEGTANILATLQTPKGLVTLESLGI
ncbi:MAG: VOC family protein [Betaproteobacteria bacterium]|nr:VOC family protein [Betaproteobacteria bacterium]